MNATTSIIALLLASALSASAEPQCPEPCPQPGKARFRTVAWVSTTCRTDANGLLGHQEVIVQRGDRPPVIVSQTDFGPVPDPNGLCRTFATIRDGEFSVVGGVYTGLAISPDGSHVVFERNERFSFFGLPPLPEDDRGLFLARSDGRDVEKIHAATTKASLSPGNGTFDRTPKRLQFSPDGRYVVFPDLGAAPDGSVGAQLWSLRLADRKAVQLTALPSVPGGAGVFYVFDFADDRTVVFKRFDDDPDGNLVREDFYSVSLNGRRLRKLSPIEGPNGQVVPQFGLTGHRPAATGLYVDGIAENGDGTQKPRELFVALGRNVLQLTRFNRTDFNLDAVVSRNGERVFFSQSADPLGCNPSHNCQMFSIDTLGSDLRQLTAFEDGAPAPTACYTLNAKGHGCYPLLLAEDRATKSFIFVSSCDPFGTNPNGSQLFAMRPDGSGMRQITHERGVITDTPDVIEVELPGPSAVQ